MRHLQLLAALVFAAAASVSPAAAQVCNGMASFAAGPVQVAGSAGFSSGVQAFGVGASLGSPAGPFGTVGLGSASYDNLDGSTFIVDAGAGYQMPLRLGAIAGAQICPVANFSLGFGPHNIAGTGVDASTRDFSFGVQLGAPLKGTRQLQVIPTGGISLAYTSVKLDDGANNSVRASDTYANLDLGVGFVVNSILSIRPGASIPVGLDNGDATLGLTMGVNFGSRRP